MFATVPSAVRTVVALLAALAVLGGGALLAVDSSERDDDGYFRDDPKSLTSAGYAASDSLEVGPLDGAETGIVDHVFGRARIEATPTSGKPVLVGVARRRDLDGYLDGGALSGAPAAQDFWSATSVGSGRQTLDWRVREGDWVVAVLNADGSPHVAADVVLGAKTNALRWLGFGLLGAGVLALAGVAVSLRSSRQR